MGKFKNFLESIDTNVSVGADAPYSSGDHGNQVNQDDWYARGDARNPFGNKKSKKKKLKKRTPIQEDKGVKKKKYTITIDQVGDVHSNDINEIVKLQVKARKEKRKTFIKQNY